MSHIPLPSLLANVLTLAWLRIRWPLKEWALSDEIHESPFEVDQQYHLTNRNKPYHKKFHLSASKSSTWLLCDLCNINDTRECIVFTVSSCFPEHFVFANDPSKATKLEHLSQAYLLAKLCSPYCLAKLFPSMYFPNMNGTGALPYK